MTNIGTFRLREWEEKEMKKVKEIWPFVCGLIFQEGKERICREREGLGLVIWMS